MIRFPFKIPEFTIERKELLDIFITDELRTFIINSNIPHLESSGEALLIFPGNLRLAQIHEYSTIIKFMDQLRGLVKNSSELALGEKL